MSSCGLDSPWIQEIFYLTTHSTHFIYRYMASDIWLRTILIVREETSCRHIGYSFQLAARVLLYAPSHRQDNTYHGLCYTSRWIDHDDRTALVRVGEVFGAQIDRDQTLQHHVIPLINVTGGIFQQDNAKEHTAQVCRDFIQQSNRTPLGHPRSQSSSKEPFTTNTTGTVLGFTNSYCLHV